MNNPHIPQTYGYARVSTTGQNLARQLASLHEAGIDDAHIFKDKRSGKDFNRPAWKKLLKRMKSGDLLVVTSLDRFGRNYEEMTEVWSELVRVRNIHIRVLDMPILDTTACHGLTAAFIGDLVLRVLSYVAESERTHIRERQRQGILAAKSRGVRFGRPKLILTPQLELAIHRVTRKELSTREAAKLCNISKTKMWELCRDFETRDISLADRS